VGTATERHHVQPEKSMLENLITISLVGLVVGFVFSMPIAGPVSILITSHGLRGELRYCFTAALGASIIDLIVCFIAVQGATKVLGLYAAVIPYALLAGAVFLFIVGVRIVKARFDFNHLDVKQTGVMRFFSMNEKNGFWTGLVLNASNPSIFFGWLTSSFIIISFVSSLGLHVGGLDQMLVDNVASVNKYASHNTGKGDIIPSIAAPKLPVAPPDEKSIEQDNPPELFRVFFSLSYAFFVAAGTIVWFFLFSYFLIRNRKKLRVDVISNVIHGLGIFLCGFALFLVWRALDIFIS
jgi:threonine/homoserine/homoserine lactone efflux protein